MLQQTAVDEHLAQRLVVRQHRYDRVAAESIARIGGDLGAGTQLVQAVSLSHARTRCPALSRFAAITLPIRPVPMTQPPWLPSLAASGSE